ncbi:tRNA pseudouridine synthase Pus10 isoform X2 [Takifugu rubripes]|uniref:tRNA pseudouridine synthase Pus10 n=2 Tax=Takifugu rubripes TaxID=31033 RepID=H2S1W0_TAKRU|nr:putative tRNA pseudouridine synthase Pus10 isoform X2 [Takifugu rubripes]XP_011610934.1 putative tRNA pseudouridine synthase Pus10 isoform X2 [Takifugu rubripes]|eukprot:XP_011610933.1 PREDICTED: putative tRNA pseudouridine synthase Pus10 isoform X1 [Takifugu rubripes]
MLPLKEKDKPVVQKLLAAGCCSRCVLRFCCTSVQAAFRQPEQETLKELQAFINNNEIVQDSPDSTEETKSHDASGSETRGDPPSKRAKLEHCASGDASKDGTVTVEMQEDEESHVCVACLGVLQEFCDVTRAIKIAAAVKAEQYEFDSLVLSVSLPPQLCVREHSCWLHVKKEVREKCMSLSEDDVIQVKEAFKWVMQGLIAKELGGVAVVTKSLFEVGVEFSHPETDSDCYFLASTCPNCFKPTKNKQSVFTRMAVVKALDKISDFAFLKHYPSPPARPSRHCVQQDVQCLHVSLFIAGRYNKFCRSLPQTPWVIDGQRRMESSVEELIAAPILVTFRADGFNFSSSGREDVDVRTLGNGRPFAMELLNPHRSRVSKVEMKQLQETINASSDKIRVRDLQIVTREATSRMKEGEEEKTKSYTALVWTHKAIQREDLSFMDDIKDLTLNQKTPLRVLHRRALAVRQRVIHSMSTRFVDAHHFYLGLKTQAGTYIKEFVHGDFGRTQPNMCELLKTDTDILELDVESVDVDWPPTVTD